MLASVFEVPRPKFAERHFGAGREPFRVRVVSLRDFAEHLVRLLAGIIDGQARPFAEAKPDRTPVDPTIEKEGFGTGRQDGDAKPLHVGIVDVNAVESGRTDELFESLAREPDLLACWLAGMMNAPCYGRATLQLNSHQ